MYLITWSELVERSPDKIYIWCGKDEKDNDEILIYNIKKIDIEGDSGTIGNFNPLKVENYLAEQVVSFFFNKDDIKFGLKYTCQGK